MCFFTYFSIPLKTEIKKGTEVELVLKDLKGGHSGVEIDKGRVNADILAGRVLSSLENFDIISINGGDKSNAIPNKCVIRLCGSDVDGFRAQAEECLKVIKNEISAREKDFSFY